MISIANYGLVQGRSDSRRTHFRYAGVIKDEQPTRVSGNRRDLGSGAPVVRTANGRRRDPHLRGQSYAATMEANPWTAALSYLARGGDRTILLEPAQR